MLLEAAISGDGVPSQLHHSTSWAALGFTEVEQLQPSGPLFIDKTGVWASNDAHVVTSPWIPPPDFLTRPGTDLLYKAGLAMSHGWHSAYPRC
jgi:hypothetical protein